VPRFLVLHDYGMGGLWWWITAPSAEHVVHTLAEVEVVTDPEVIEQAGGWNLDEVDLDGELPPPLDEMRDQRTRQRRHPDFGALVGSSPVYLRLLPDEVGDVILVELGPDGRRLRQVIHPADGDATRQASWPVNSPFDLYDPEFAAQRIDRAEFEQAWSTARTDEY
jgi:hypothetical protein